VWFRLFTSNGMAQYIYYQWKQYPVPIQYSLPKWINSVEAGILIDGTIEDSDILSIFYDWDKEWIVKIVNEDGDIRIRQNNPLPDDAKEYEKFIYNSFFSEGRINLIGARVLIMDYCLKKWWIEDYWPEIWKILNTRRLWTLLSFLVLTIVVGICIWVGMLILLLVLWINSFHATYGFSSNWSPMGVFFILYVFGKFLLSFYISARITIWRLKKIKVKKTSLGTSLLSQLLWYKKYLEQIRLGDNNEKENTEMQYWTAAHNTVLKTDKTYYTIKHVKKFMHIKNSDLSFFYIKEPNPSNQ
jgi:hypothetical protein